MKLTPIQKKVLRNKGMCKVVYKKIFRTEGALGYTAKGGYFYDIHIASDVKPTDVQLVTLIHECGHVDLCHMEVKLKEELRDIKKIFEQKNVPFTKIGCFGGPVSFLNIAMDLQVNGRYLTPKNIELMKKAGFDICIPEKFNIAGLLGDFRNYYEPLVDYIASLPEPSIGSPQDSSGSSDDSESDNSNNSSSSGESSGKNNNSKKSSKGKSSKDNNSNEDDSSEQGEGSGESSEEGDEEDQDKGYQLPKWAQDLPQNIDEEETKAGDEELDKEIEKEDYKSGTEKAREDNQSGKQKEETTVDKATDAAEDQESSAPGISPKQSYGIGKSPEATNVLGKIVENNNENIREFLNRIIRVSYDYMQDPIRHHNRGTRRNDSGLLYNAIRRKPRDTRTKIGVLVDVSGSMDASTLLNGLGAVKASMDVISPESRLVTWNTRLVQEFPILEIPETIYSSGGTDMYAGLKYLADEGFKTIVLYSDMATEIPTMTELIKRNGIDMYTIVVDASDRRQDTELESYLKVNKNFLRVN